MDQRQEKSALSLTFLNRTDFLAARLQIGVKELPQVMGISTGTLFAGRRGDDKVSAKTWLKLDHAEAAAVKKCNPGAKSNEARLESAQSTSYLNESKRDGSEKSDLSDHAHRIAALESQVRILSAALASILPGQSNIDSKQMNG